MRYLYALFGLVLIASCATTQSPYPANYLVTTDQRFARCTAQNLDGYIGDCVIKSFDSEPSHNEWLELLEVKEDWSLLVDANNDISRKYAVGELNTETANLMFERMYNLTKDIFDTKGNNLMAQAEADRIKKAQMWMALGDALQSSNNTLNGRTGTTMPSVAPTMPTIQKPKVSYRLDSQYVEGKQKVCVYKDNFGKTEFVVKDTTYAICDMFITK